MLCGFIIVLATRGNKEHRRVNSVDFTAFPGTQHPPFINRLTMFVLVVKTCVAQDFRIQ